MASFPTPLSATKSSNGFPVETLSFGGGGGGFHPSGLFLTAGGGDANGRSGAGAGEGEVSKAENEEAMEDWGGVGKAEKSLGMVDAAKAGVLPAIG